MDGTVFACVHNPTLLAAILEVQPAADLQTRVKMYDEQTELKAGSPMSRFATQSVSPALRCCSVRVVMRRE